jgi:hypothetical protein
VAKPGKKIWISFKTLRTRSVCNKHDDHVQVWDGSDVILDICKNETFTAPLISKSSQLKIVYISPNGTLDASGKFFFLARIIAVNALETGSHVKGSLCDAKFDAADRMGGPFELISPKELVLTQHRGDTLLTCRY